MLNINKQFQTSVTPILGPYLIFFQLSKCKQKQCPSFVNITKNCGFLSLAYLKIDLNRDHAHLMSQQIERCKGSFIKIDNV